jgi:hypothetical protein
MEGRPMPDLSLPGGIEVLFPDRGADRVLEVGLPAGRLVAPEGGGRPLYWLSDGPADAATWIALRMAHPKSGLWPLLVQPLRGEVDRPWGNGEVRAQDVGSIDAVRAPGFLADQWPDIDDDEGLMEMLVPFERWPGLARSGHGAEDPDDVADWWVEENLWREDRLLLVAADRAADALTAAGWQGPVNFSQTMAPLSAVLRSWEDRFGVRVVRLGYDTLELSVAGPPETMDDALSVAAKHLSFCPDNIFQGAGSVEAYAEQILGRETWGFWWD